MAQRAWKVLASLENDQQDRCVDIFARTGGSFGFEKYLRDPEDNGRTRIADYGHRRYPMRADAEAAAHDSVKWLAAR